MGHLPLQQWWPTRGTRAISGTSMLSKWHTQSHYKYINADSQEFTIFWKNLPLSLFPALPDMALRYRCRFGSTYLREKTVSIVKYRSILTDHHLKHLLILLLHP